MIYRIYVENTMTMAKLYAEKRDTKEEAEIVIKDINKIFYDHKIEFLRAVIVPF